MVGGGEDGVGGVADGVGEEVSAHAVIGLGVADHRLDGGAALHLALDGLGHAPPLAGDEHPEFAVRRRIVAAIAAVGENALHRRPNPTVPSRE